ncbi:MAG: tetratricopeptide repeat protein [Candidatus Obscuribacterales bacterium]|nr:tetratricopeptide repeat protein [Candidatus Obscuribacterales bacterium]
MSNTSKSFVDDLINSYFDLGSAALERKEYAIAQKMFKAVFEEAASKAQKEGLMLDLLLKSAETHVGLKQNYKAKLLYIRALALYKRQVRICDMQVLRILLRLAELNARQNLYRQALEFVEEAYAGYEKCLNPSPAEFVSGLRRTEKLLLLKNRKFEQKRILEIMQIVKMEALQSIPATPDFVPSTGFVSTQAH